MRIAVVGAGAMGSLFGGLLAEAGEDVVLVDIWEEHVRAINERGLHIKGVSGDRVVRVRATTKHAEVGVVDLMLIQVKSYATEKAIRDALPMIGERTVVLTLQNGLGNVEKIAAVVGRERVLAGTTAHGATVLGPGEIYHAGRGLTVIGEVDGRITDRVKAIAELFNRAGIETEVTDNIMGAIWTKMLANVAINALTAITGLYNGELLELEETKAVMLKAVDEAVAVAKAMGIKLLVEDPHEFVLGIARATATNKSSMLQDVERGRRTEIDAINGMIVHYGRELGIPTPINEALVAAVKGIELRMRKRKA